MSAEYMPISSNAWEVAAQRHSVLASSIHDEEKQPSGSHMSYKQFLLLRAIWPEPAHAVAICRLWEANGFISEEARTSAVSFLAEKLPSWLAYLDALRSSQSGPATIAQGAFALVRRYHQRIAAEVSKQAEALEKNDFTPIKTRSRFAAELRANTQESPSTMIQKARQGTDPCHFLLDMDMEGEKAEEDEEEEEEEEEEDEEDSDSDSDSNSDDSDSDDKAGIPRTPTRNPLSEALAIRPKLVNYAETPLSGASSSHLPDAMSPDVLCKAPVKDEQIVNTALLLLTQALTVHYPLDVNGKELQSYWTEHRLAFQVISPNGQKVYESRVDGYLCRDHDPLVILEVKPGSRSAKIDEIRKQETGQMAAWIAKHPPEKSSKKYRRLLVSQDHNEVYLTVATFNWDYVQYIRGEVSPNAGKRSLLVMKEYGPFSVRDALHMKWLGEILLSITLAGEIMQL